MGRNRNRKPYLEEVEITDFGAEGKALGKVDEKVVFVPFTAPGDIVDVQVSKKRKNFMVGRAEKFHRYSELRTEPFCKHFGVCGGCKWQHVPYDKQLEFKQQQVTDQLTRIGHLDIPEVSPILGSDKTQYYRNKLEFTFSNMKWITDYRDDMDFDQMNMNGLGFHPPGMFDRILDLEECYLQPDLSNVIRKRVKELAELNGYSFYNARKKEGLLRNVLIRNNENDQWMVVLILNSDNRQALENILKPLKQEIPRITSTMYIVNNKLNDSLDGLQAKPFEGETYLTEKLEDLIFKVGPLSFFQTNTGQALNMYRKVRLFADIQQDDIVYDLYTGTGSIALFVAEQARKVVGIEYVTEAIHDANVNKEWNKVENAEFFAGDMVEVLSDDFIAEQGTPDVIIADPPRAGMHKDVISQMLKIAPRRIVYVSCNPATQARDVAMMNDKYEIKKVQPVDMFPHTHHVENILLLERID